MIDLTRIRPSPTARISPQELVDAGIVLGLDALAITTTIPFAGYEQARPFADNGRAESCCAVLN